MKRPLPLLACLLLSSPWLRASEDSTTAGRLLSESLSARSSGLAEAGTALTGDLGVLSFNPAGLPLMSRGEVLARFQTSPGDVRTGVLGCGRKWGRAAWGLGAAYLDAGTIDLAFSDGRRFSRAAQRDFAGQAGVGFSLSDVLSFGVGARFIRSELVEEFSASAVAGDAGLLLASGGWRLGASARNMGGDLTYRNQGDPLPGELRVGVAYSYSPGGRSHGDAAGAEWYRESEEETPIFTVAADGVRDVEGSLSGAAAFEWTKWPKAAFRVGYGFGESAAGLTFGFGLNLVKCSLDYSWRFVDDLADAHRLSFSIYWD